MATKQVVATKQVATEQVATKQVPAKQVPAKQATGKQVASIVCSTMAFGIGLGPYPGLHSAQRPTGRVKKKEKREHKKAPLL